MEQITRPHCWVRGGKIEEIVWIGKEVLAWCIGLYIVFFHVAKKRQTLRWCWNDVTGDGAHCIAGHVSSPIFAFSERSLRPRIFVHAYPSMTRICECVQGCINSYLAIAFTPHDHLVSLGAYPNFPLIVWCWRTGEKIAIVNTPIRDEVGQTIRITPVGRTVIGQVGKSCGKLLTWELDVVDKIVILKDHEVNLPKENATIHGISWCPTPSDPVLAITDLHGHVYLSNYDGTAVQRVVFSQRCWICTNVELPGVCWFREGIILRTTFCQIRYFKRDPKINAWRKQWCVKATYEPYILIVHPLRNDRFFYYTYEGYLMQMTFSETDGKPTIHNYFHYGSRYRFVDFLYPWCHHLAVTNDLRELTVLESYSGGDVSKVELDMEGAISAQISHPDEPSIVVVSDQGEMTILGFTDPEQPMILAYFRLQRKPLDFIKFSHSGKFLIAAQRETGNCYFISRDVPYNVIAQLRIRKPIVDVVIHEEARESLKVLVLLVKFKQFNVAAGQQFLVYDVPLDLSIEPKTIGVVTLPGLFYDLCHAPGDDPELLVASPYLKRQLHVLKLQREDATLTDTALTGHHVRLVRTFADRHWIATCAYDGLVVIRAETVRQVVAVVPAHHRLDSGTRRAIVNVKGDTMIALGHDGSLIARRVLYTGKENAMSIASIETDNVYTLDNAWYERQKETILSDYVSLDPAIRASLTRARQECPASDENRTWEERSEYMRRSDEEELYAAEKAIIKKHLSDLKTILAQLVDANETRPEIERLPVSAFGLDRIGRDRKLKVAADERENFRTELERFCASMDRLACWIKTTFWDPQIVLGRSIFSFRDDTEVTNYPMTEEDPCFRDYLRWAHFAKESESHVTDDRFELWRKYTSDQLRTILSKPVRIRRDEVYERRKMRAFLEDEKHEIEEILAEETAEMRKLNGMTTHRFVEQSPYYYSQMETYGFAHATLEDRYLMNDCNKLRAYFNKLFDDMYETKKREMSVIRERNEKIRHIDSELRTMFGQTVPQVPIDPQLHFKEEAESIVEVLDREIKAKPYMSPSRREILDEQAAERERIERLLLADDFRERAMIKMMDGVLEVRWEDTIKMDVRKPACMLEKQPEQYTSDDVTAVRKYEADVEALRQERERYRRMLEADYAKINGLLQNGIEKFDAKLNEFFQLKLRVDAALNQLKLRHNRGRLRNLAKVKAVKEDDKSIREITEKRRYNIALEKHAQNLRDVCQDMFAQHDALSAREKAVIKKYQEFSGLSKTAIEHLERQYRRRPRIYLKSVTARDLLDLAKFVTDYTKPIYLPAECLDYVKILENIDARPDELPQSVDASHWDQLVRSRRQKIEIELRIRAKQLEIAAAEQTIAVFEGKIDACKSSVDLLRNQMRNSRDERIKREQDAEIQLVLRMGQVEIKLWGGQRDAVDAILVPRGEIERVNEHIAVAGTRKLDSLKRTIDFRHGTLMLEWEHRCLKMRFDELEEDLRFLQDVTVTWDLRVYLKRRARGLRDDKTAVQLEKEIEMTRKTLEKTLSKQTDKLQELRRKINHVKKKNAELDRAVAEFNVKRWELEHQRDVARETRQREHADRKMRLIKQRSDLIKQLQDNYTELLALQTERELLKLRKYPTFEYVETDRAC